jgi:hypothetical protein
VFGLIDRFRQSQQPLMLVLQSSCEAPQAAAANRSVGISGPDLGQRKSFGGSSEFEGRRGAENPLLADRADGLLVTVDGSEFSQKGVSLPRLHLPHDIIFGKRATFFGEYGIEQLAC